MASLLHPALWGVLVVGTLFTFVFVVAAASDTVLTFNDRREQVVASFGALRLTSKHLIVGNRKDAERIPLTGLAVAVKQMESAVGSSVVVTVMGADRPTERREPLTFGSSGEAQILAVLFGRMARAT
ncbi:MAG: hypothetical protein KIH64_009910, partial [Mycobacterium sp.]|nr:hypothetical protein [Mycobacterium sp.]